MKTLFSRFCVFALLLLSAGVAWGSQGPKQACLDLKTPTNSFNFLENAEISTNPTFEYKGRNDVGGYDLVVIWLQTTDGNTTITKLGVTCTVSRDDNVTEHIPQKSSVDSITGIATIIDSNAVHKENPGTKNFPVRFDFKGYPDFKCAITAVTGSAEVGDQVTAQIRACTGGR